MAQWPTSIATDANLYVAVNSLSTFTSAPVAPTDTTINVLSSAFFPAAGIVLLDNELVAYAAVVGNTITGCTRGFDGTTSAAHNQDVPVSFCIPAAHHNLLKNEIEAIETYLAGLFGLGASISQSVSLNSHKVINLTDPTSLQDAATKNYVDSNVASPPSGITLNNQLPVVFMEQTGNGTDSVTLEAPNDVTTSYVLKLPPAQGSAGSVLENDGAGNLSWAPAASNFVPSGAMLDFAGTSAPSGWLLCDGSVVSQTTFAALFAAIGATWNTGGEGAGNFRLPDFRRRAAVGSGGTGTSTLGNAVGNTGGEETHTLTTPEMPSHTHTATVTDPGHTHTTSPNDVWHNSGGSVLSGGGASSTTSVVVNSATTGITVGNSNTGGGGSHNNIQPSAVVLKIIKT